jgi:hypothetical protein
LFKNLIKIVGIASGNPDTVDNKKRIQMVLRQFQFEQFNQIDKPV